MLHWQYFLLSLVICVSGALLYLRYATPVYQMSVRMIIKGDESSYHRNTRVMSNMSDFGFTNNSTGVFNEGEILQSRMLLRDVVKDLKIYAEYRSQGRLRKPVVYGSQPVIADLDPLHLDSLDKAFNEDAILSGLQLKISRDDSAYNVRVMALMGDGENIGFIRHPKTLPAYYQTPLGTLTLTANPTCDMQPGEVSLVTILPPMLVATKYMASMRVETSTVDHGYLNFTYFFGKRNSNIARLTLWDRNVKRGMDFLRHLADCYNRQASSDLNEIALRSEAFINERIQKLSKELGSTEGQIEHFMRQQAVTGSATETMLALKGTDLYANRLTEADAEIQMIDDLREYVDDPKNKYQIIPSGLGLTDKGSIELIAGYNKAVQERNRLLTAASEEAPHVQTLTQTIDQMQNSIGAALIQARQNIDIRRRNILNEYGKYRGRISSAPMQERVLEKAGRQQKVKSRLFTLLLKKREEVTASMTATARKGWLIDEPLYEGKVKPDVPWVLGSALLLGVAVPFAIVWLISLLRYKIANREDVEQQTSLPIVADLPTASDVSKSAAGIVVKESESTPMNEPFGLLRTNIHFMLKPGENVILFTSSTSGEGKSFCSANVAASFAMLGKRVIICGLDIRKPSLDGLFGVDGKGRGITNLLAKELVTEEDLEGQIVKSGIRENLDLLLAGPIPPSPAELLGRDAFRQVISILRKKYDFVIMDTAPVGLVTDTLMIAAQANISVIVCRVDFTPKASIGYLDKLAVNGQLPNACVALNGLRI